MTRIGAADQMPSEQSPVPIPGYNLTPPGEAEVLAALQRVHGAPRGTAIWESACQTAGVAAGSVRRRGELERLLAVLAEAGGPPAVVARSMEIRLRTYDRLMARGVVPTGGAR